MAAPRPRPWLHRAYAAAMDAALPAIRVYLWQRALTGVDRWDRVHERLGMPTVHRRPQGVVFWFHGASIGECALAVSLVERCLQERPYATILFTTQDTHALSFLERTFPKELVFCQYAPIDTARAVDTFLRFWRPRCAVFLESELWPNLLLSPHLQEVGVGILNARMSHRSFARWSAPGAASLASAMLSRVTLLTTPNGEQGLNFQLLGVNPMGVHFTGDLKFATQGLLDRREADALERLRQQVGKRPLWVAASTHPGEEEVVARIHVSFLERFPNLLTIVCPRHPQRRHAIVKLMRASGLTVALRSRREAIQQHTQVFLADTTGEMDLWYSLASLAFVGGSLVPGVGGHNLSEAAFCSCAVVVGPHVENFQGMIKEMQRSAPLSVLQVEDEVQLREAVGELLGNEAKLNARSIAAKRAATAASEGVVKGVWRYLDSSLLANTEPGPECEKPLKEDGPDAELSPILHKQLLRSELDQVPENPISNPISERSVPAQNGSEKVRRKLPTGSSPSGPSPKATPKSQKTHVSSAKTVKR